MPLKSNSCSLKFEVQAQRSWISKRFEHDFLRHLRNLRESRGADLLALIVERSNDYLGTASLARDQANSANQVYSANLRMGLPWGSLLAHELGHNFGCGHDRDNAGTAPYFFPDSYGHRFVAKDINYVTVMSYWPGFWIPHFSNPEVSYEDQPTGVPEPSPNLRDWSDVRTWLSESESTDMTLPRPGTHFFYRVIQEPGTELEPEPK